MVARQQPSNSDLLKEIKSMQSSVTRIDGRVENLEVWRISSDASREAVEKYKRDERFAKTDKSKIEVAQALLPFIIALTALAYAFITYLGRVK